MIATERNKINAPILIPSAEHNILRSHVSDHALKVLARLREAGYASYLVGGCVRDLMLGGIPKDFDVVTDARPEQIKAVFRNARLIGRRFRLAHVHFGREIIEVATFRANPANIPPEHPAWQENGEDTDAVEPRVRDHAIHNVFGTEEEDAVRRDFTVNALYYDPESGTVRDYVGGVADLRQGLLRVIGDPETRYREDPVRMLRAVRFAAKLGLQLDAGSAALLPKLASLLAGVSPARLFDETLKLFHGGCALATYELLRQYDLFRFLFPLSDPVESDAGGGLLTRALANTDQRIRADKPVTPAFLFAAVLWAPVRRAAAGREGESSIAALQAAAEQVLRVQLRTVTLPKRFSFPMREIWALQPKFHRRSGKHAARLMEHKRFRAAYDFLLLRAETGEESAEIADWWTRYQAVDPQTRNTMVQALAPEPGRKRRRRSRRAR